VKGKKQPIMLARGDVGHTRIPRPVVATVFGHWAVHRGVDFWALGWTVTHVPTGMAARNGITTAAEAKRIAVALATEFNFDSLAALEALSRKATARISAIVRGEL
jgi:hypothetical protein